MGYFLMRLPSLNAAGARQRRGEKPTSSAVSPIHRRGGGKGYMAQLPEDAKNHFCAESIDALKNLQREGLMPHVPAKKKRPDEKKQDRRLPTASQNRNCRPVGNVRNFLTPRGAPGSMWGSVGEVFGKF